MPGQFLHRHLALGVGQQIVRRLSGQGHLSPGQPRDRLRNGRHLQSAEKQQQLQHLHLQIPLPQVLRHLIQLREYVLHPPGGPCGEIPPGSAEFLRQGGGLHLHVLQKAGQTPGRPPGIHGNGNAVIVPGGKRGRGGQHVLPCHGQVPRSQVKIPVPQAILHASLPAMADLQSPGGGGVHGTGPGVDVVIADVDAGKHRIKGHRRLAPVRGFPADGVLRQRRGIMQTGLHGHFFRRPNRPRFSTGRDTTSRAL